MQVDWGATMQGKQAKIVSPLQERGSFWGTWPLPAQEPAGHTSLAMTQRSIEGDTEAKRQRVALR